MMNDQAIGVFREPRIGEPETSFPGAEALAGGPSQFLAPNIPDTSGPGPTALETPGHWIYDFDPGTGVARATFNGEVNFTTGGAAASVTSWNTRTGAVVLTAADLTGVGGALAANIPAASTTPPLMDGTAAVGTGTTWGRADHVHPTDTSRFPIVGVTNGSAAPAGQVGEIVIGAIGGGPLTTGANANAGTLVLTAGDWDVWARCNFVPSANPTITAIQLGVSTVSATFNGTGDCGGSILIQATSFAVGGTQTVNTAPCRISLSAGATIYAVALCNFSPGGVAANAFLSARRVR